GASIPLSPRPRHGTSVLSTEVARPCLWPRRQQSSGAPPTLATSPYNPVHSSYQQPPPWRPTPRMRKPIIAGNWKMYKTPRESLAFLEVFLPLVEGHTRDEIALFPTMSSL